MSYAFYKDARDGDTVTLANGVRYQYQEAKNRWMVQSLHDADVCPRFDAVATQFKDYGNPNEQVVINYHSGVIVNDNLLVRVTVILELGCNSIKARTDISVMQ